MIFSDPLREIATSNEKTKRSLNQDFSEKLTQQSTNNREAKNPSYVLPKGWFMPKFNGRDICDWIDDIKVLKRYGDMTEALNIASECMEGLKNMN